MVNPQDNMLYLRLESSSEILPIWILIWIPTGESHPKLKLYITSHVYLIPNLCSTLNFIETWLIYKNIEDLASKISQIMPGKVAQVVWNLNKKIRALQIP